MALAARLSARGIELGTVLLGTAAYEGERADGDPSLRTGPVLLFDEDARGRGVHPSPVRGIRCVSAHELVEDLMAAERVVPFS